MALSPLGQPFPDSVSEKPETALLLAGGVGLAPLLLWAQAQQQKGVSPEAMPTLVYGVRSEAEASMILPQIREILPENKLMLCSDDGSLGHHGHVVSWVEAKNAEPLQAFENVLICGPNRMMTASVEAVKRLIPKAKAYVSLENHMPCGTGACFGCVVGQAEGNPPVKVCEAGPVFDAATLAWEVSGPQSSGFTLAESCYPRFDVEGASA